MRRSKSEFQLLLLLFVLLLSWWQGTTFTQEIPADGEPIHLYTTATDDLKHLYLQAFQNAKESIHIMTFTLTDATVIQTLREKSEEGVTVTVVCDAKGSPGLARKLGKKIPLTRTVDNGLMHIKITVIDDTLTLLGSANLTSESLQLHSNLTLAIPSPSFATYCKEKSNNLGEETLRTPLPYQPFLIAEQPASLTFLPDDQKGTTRLLKLINSAEKTLRVAMFTFTRIDFAEALIAAKKRGVDVQICLDQGNLSGFGNRIVERFKEANIPLSIYTGPGLLHHKFVWVDGHMLASGSANWTKAAFKSNADCILFLEDLTEQQNRSLKALWKDIYRVE
ncbi:MAG: phosphatidylserine/phosphatidylglycerophosphate/cardiolipin synthase family protein [Chlamydiia bacterium]|nr:phosphatidylserine/phosphatidylglycerophosphate/cardiolipin synthase family protein [Chlamydiia bacterium]